MRCVCRTRSGILTEAGGQLISIPVSYFNGKEGGGWKGFFQNPKRSFIVAMIEFTNQKTRRHEASFLGSPEDLDTNVSLTEKCFVGMRKQWEDDGGRLMPFYELKKVFDRNAPTFDFRADPDPKGKDASRAGGTTPPHSKTLRNHVAARTVSV